MLSVTLLSLFLAPVGCRVCYTSHNANTCAYSDCSVCDQTKDITSPHRLLTLLKGQRKKNIANCILILWSETKHDSVRMNWDKFALPSKHLSVWSSFFSVVLRWCWYAFEWGCFQMWLKKSAMRQGINISNLRAISAEKDSWQLLRKSESIAACLHMQEITYAST